MSFFSGLEKSLEYIIEKTLLGKFGGHVQPIEIARDIWRQMINNKRISIKDTYVPNSFTITLSPGDFENFKGIITTVESEILNYIKKEAAMREFKFSGALEIKWINDDQVRDGEFFVTPEFVESDFSDTASADTIEHPALAGAAPKDESDTIVRKPGVQASQSVKPAELSGILIVTEGFDQGKAFKVTEKEYIIGRDSDCDIIIGDGMVSRKHARLFPEGKRFYIEDLNSKGGLYLNGERIAKEPVINGDEIKIGITVLKYRGV